MDKNKYFETAGAKLGFIPKHWRITVFIISLLFLFHILTLGINIASEINRPPNIEDVNKKFSSVKIRKNILNSIEKFFSAKRERAAKYLANPLSGNPFLPYPTSSEIPPISSPNPSPSPEP